MACFCIKSSVAGNKISRRTLKQCTISETKLAKQHISRCRVTLRHSVDHIYYTFMTEKKLFLKAKREEWGPMGWCREAIHSLV
jgi:hypothetical protein